MQCYTGCINSLLVLWPLFLGQGRSRASSLAVIGIMGVVVEFVDNWWSLEIGMHYIWYSWYVMWALPALSAISAYLALIKFVGGL